jgi:hypothetical protein
MKRITSGVGVVAIVIGATLNGGAQGPAAAVSGKAYKFEPVADGWTRHACVDAGTHRPTRVPAWLVEAIVSSEG